MKDNELRKALKIYGEESDQEFIIFENPSFDKSIIGFSDDGRVIYDFNKMIQEYMDDNSCDEEEAIDFIDYNTMRALPYAGDQHPIVIVESPDTLKEKY